MSGVAARTVLLPGRADAAGTALYAQLMANVAGQGHFRKFPTEVPEVGELTVSSVGLGTYLGPETDAADKEYQESMTRALPLGINVFDAAINYRSMRSERNVGTALSEAFSGGVISRQQVVVCTKGGFLTFDVKRPANPRQYVQETYVDSGIFDWSDFVGGCHCMTPAYIKDQLERSRKNLGLETIDVYYIHNPETQLSAVSREEFNSRIEKAFSVLEEAVKEGKISVFGVATWNGFRVPPEDPGHLSLADLVKAAQAAGGEGHHFRVVQAPFNLQLQELADKDTQIVQGQRMPLVNAAKELGVSVIASGSLMQANLARGLPPQIKTYFKALGDTPTDAQCALQFVRTTPGILTALSGMRQVSHLEENAGIIHRSALTR
ncbi:unnamed protein product [Calypogeia fissa]